MRITFIINSNSRKLKRIIAELNEHFVGIEDVNSILLLTDYKGHAIELARQSVKDSDFIIAVGGDGTMSEVVNGIMSHQLPVAQLPIVGLLASGSGNDFAKVVKAPHSAKALKESIINNQYRKIDIGKIERSDEATKYFNNIAGLGISPEVAINLDKSSRPLGSTVAFSYAILRTFFPYKRKGIKITTRDWTWEGQLLQLAIGNGKYFGNGICITPDAQLDDGKFHVSIFGELSVWDYIKNIGDLKKGVKLKHKDAHYYSTNSLSVEALPNNSSYLEADGEFLGVGVPSTISVIQQALKFIDNELISELANEQGK